LFNQQYKFNKHKADNTMLAWHGHSLQTAAMNCYAQNSTGVIC